MESRLIRYSYHVLFALTPLIWTSLNYELFEYNKMVFVYFLTIIICTFWALKMLKRKRFLIKKTPLDLPILLFLSANIISTILSIDPHTSWWGYYSRSNGGLLSIISYTLLYYGLVANFGSTDVPKLLRSALIGGLIAAAWAIPEHFGSSTSCLILTSQANAGCWVQDVQARVFSTLGQPNWLAAYLAMIIFPSLYFLIASKTRLQRICYLLLAICYYLAFTFTYSRGAMLGFLVGVGVFIFLFLRCKLGGVGLALMRGWMPAVILMFLFINLLFGSAVTSFQLINKFAAPVRESVTEAVTKPTAGTQLETGGTESGSIRLIVWKGALDIFRHYPIFGSGVETFAYSYYRFRPASHNLVSEWDFLYNKAHNEYLNYLANTGLIGFLSYILLIGTFLVWSIKRISLEIRSTSTLVVALLASYISYLIQNFFGFSVVVVALFFYLFPALIFIFTDSLVEIQLSKRVSTILSFLNRKLVKLFITPVTNLFIIIAGFLFLFNLSKYYLADTIFARGAKANEMGNPSKAYNLLIKAVALNTSEPLYRSELSFAAAAASSALINEDATLSAKLKDQAVYETKKVLTKSPNNVSLMRNSIRAYYLLSTIDSGFNQKTLELLDRAIELAPTDPKLTYNKAVILGSEDRTKEAIGVLEDTVLLKPNYRDAHYALSLFYFEDVQKDKAITQMKKVLSIIPSDSEAQEKLKAWEGK